MRRICFALLVMLPLAVFPLTGALAKNGGNGGGGGGDGGNAGGSDRSFEVRQNGDNNGGGGGNNGGGGSGGTGTPDAGDNMHPSGNDKSVEPGGSFPQGHSQSDPDGMSNGGADKPGGTGGIDQDDQDGNNGCGNDDDFEDDNNGNCGGLKKGLTEETNVVVGGEVAEGTGTFAASAGTGTHRVAVVEPVFTPAGTIDGAVVGPVETGTSSPTEVLAAAATNAADAVHEFGAGVANSGVLPRSGGGIATMLLASLGLMAFGVVAMRAGRLRH
jgi:hypothetical protein